MFTSMCLLIENEMSLDKQVLIADTILLAQHIHEKSWSGAHYLLSNSDAANKACKINQLPDYISEIILALNTFYWNDSQYWAEEIIKKNKQNNEVERFS